jgi:hypothetical protein
MDFSEISIDLNVQLEPSEPSDTYDTDLKLVDFTSLNNNVKKMDDSKYHKLLDTNQYKMNNGYEINYDEETTGYFRAIRKTHVDPILETTVDEKYAFKFLYQWDPYTGEILDKDPYGPLYFDPDSLIKYFYSVRLNNLWNPPVGEFEAFYGDALGNGPEFEIKGRGDHPEYNIFRLPIITCYLTKDNNDQNITFGPKLSDDEIKEIYNLALTKDKIKGVDSYKLLFGQPRPNLIKIKGYWDMATNKIPDIQEFDPSEFSTQELVNFYGKKNTEAVRIMCKLNG